MSKIGYKIVVLFLSFFALFFLAKEITSVKSVQDLQEVVRATILNTPGYTLTPSERLYVEIDTALDTFKNDAWVKRRKKDIEKFMREHPVAGSSAEPSKSQEPPVPPSIEQVREGLKKEQLE
jgi:hypothetical protein